MGVGRARAASAGADGDGSTGPDLAVMTDRCFGQAPPIRATASRGRCGGADAGGEVAAETGEVNPKDPAAVDHEPPAVVDRAGSCRGRCRRVGEEIELRAVALGAAHAGGVVAPIGQFGVVASSMRRAYSRSPVAGGRGREEGEREGGKGRGEEKRKGATGRIADKRREERKRNCSVVRSNRVEPARPGARPGRGS